jgi:hypothetical protein
MAWSDALVTLGAVALGGLVAALTGRLESRREARTEALVALRELHDLGASQPREAAGLLREGDLLRHRIALLRGGVPWNFVELLSGAVRAALSASWYFAAAARLELESPENDRRRKLGHEWMHPSRRTMRPTLQWLLILNDAIREELERPVRARLVRPLVAYRLRRMLLRLDDSSEMTRLLPSPREMPDQAQYLAVHRHLGWPTRKANPLKRDAFSFTRMD